MKRGRWSRNAGAVGVIARHGKAPRHAAVLDRGVPSRRAFAPRGDSMARGATAPRRGIALVSILLTIIVLSVLSLGAARMVTGDFRRVRDGRAVVDAANAADAGAYAILRDWATVPHEDLPIGLALPPYSAPVAGARTLATTTRTAPAFF